MPRLSAFHVGVAAEAIAAAQFARLGFDVSVQYGANQPEYDLIVARGERMMKVSVKGSQDGQWGLTQSFLSNANYHGAVDEWLARHRLRTVFCLVQLKGVEIGALPRVYLARPREIARRLKQSAAGRGDTILYEHKVWGPRARGYGTTDAIPKNWAFSERRGEALLRKA